MLELLTHIGELISTVYPTHTQYLTQMGSGFERPSFFIYPIASKQSNSNMSYYSRTTIIQIVYFDKLDKYQNPNKLTQSEVLSTVSKLFAIPVILIPDRSKIMVEDLLTDFTADGDPYIQLTLREDFSNVIPDKGELMEEIDIKIK